MICTMCGLELNAGDVAISLPGGFAHNACFIERSPDLGVFWKPAECEDWPDIIDDDATELQRGDV